MAKCDSNMPPPRPAIAHFCHVFRLVVFKSFSTWILKWIIYVFIEYLASAEMIFAKVSRNSRVRKRLKCFGCYWQKLLMGKKRKKHKIADHLKKIKNNTFCFRWQGYINCILFLKLSIVYCRCVPEKFGERRTLRCSCNEKRYQWKKCCFPL